MPKFTVFCVEPSRTGTTWISCVEAKTADSAEIRGRIQCARDWGFEDAGDVHVLGVAEGDVKILAWYDQDPDDGPNDPEFMGRLFGA